LSDIIEFPSAGDPASPEQCAERVERIAKRIRAGLERTFVCAAVATDGTPTVIGWIHRDDARQARAIFEYAHERLTGRPFKA
jgi:hypothetical protein